MAYFKVIGVVKQYPELVVGNIYELDDYEASVLATGASGHIMENIMFVSDEFKLSSCGKVTFGIRPPTPVVLLNLGNNPDLQEDNENLSQVSNFSDQDTQLQDNTLADDKKEPSETLESKETNIIAEVVNPIHPVLEPVTEKDLAEQYREREKELNAMLVRDLKELCDKANITYRSKSDAIQSLLRLEFPDFKP